jgi:hypothetical protein
MRFRELRHTLQAIVVAGLPGCGLVSGVVDTIGSDDACYRTVEKSFELDGEAADPPLKLRIESCRVDVDACMELCSMVAVQHGNDAQRAAGAEFVRRVVPGRHRARGLVVPLYTNNALVFVGTGGMFKVPSLVGVAARAPYMHDGCAATLRDRFGTCGGGDAHGRTSGLTEAQLADLAAFLESL